MDNSKKIILPSLYFQYQNKIPLISEQQYFLLKQVVIAQQNKRNPIRQKQTTLPSFDQLIKSINKNKKNKSPSQKKKRLKEKQCPSCSQWIGRISYYKHKKFHCPALPHKERFNCSLGCNKDFKNNVDRKEHEQYYCKNRTIKNEYPCKFCQCKFKHPRQRTFHEKHNCSKNIK